MSWVLEQRQIAPAPLTLRTARQVATGGKKAGGDLEAGYFFEPTVLTECTLDMKVPTVRMTPPSCCIASASHMLLCTKAEGHAMLTHGAPGLMVICGLSLQTHHLLPAAVLASLSETVRACRSVQHCPETGS